MEIDEKDVTEPAKEKSNLTEEVKNFYKGEFEVIFTAFFKNPIDGILAIFKNPSDKAYTNSLILFGSVFILYFIGSYILAGDARSYLSFGVFFKMSLIPVIMMFFISIIAFFIKALSGNPDFKNELQTGGLCGIPLGILVVLSIIIHLFSDSNILNLIYNPLSAGTLILLFMLYILLMLINVFQQSLKASGTKDAIAWYLAPASILMAIYLTFQVSKSLY